jgi:two-component system, LytTR family, response regulator
MNAVPPLRVFVTDDEAPARKKIVRFLAQDPGVSVVGEASNGPDAVRGIQQSHPDLLFLDVQMPKMDGFEVIRALRMDTLPRIVFVTAHDEYAIQAFEVHAFGYLLKPFDQLRFNKVLTEARQHILKDLKSTVDANLQQLLNQLQSRAQSQPKLLVQQNDRGFLLSLNKVDWAESERNYLNLHVGDQTYTVRGTLESLEKNLDGSQFLRLNRSCLVRIDFIRELQNWSHGEYRAVLLSGKTLLWTRRFLNRHPELLRSL